MFLNVVIDRLRWVFSRGRAVKSAKVRLAVPFVLYVISSQYKLAKQFTNLNQSLEELKGELHDARCKVDEIENSVQNHVTQISQMYERLLSLERYSREYNLRFHNIEESPGENCLQKIHDILANQLNLEPKLENAHRAGPRSDSKARAIICKFVKRFDEIAFRDELRNEKWKSVYNSSDANESLTRFLHTFNRISNKHAPIKSIKIKGKSNKPWITKGLKKSIKVRNQLYKNWLTTRNSYYYNRYKMYRNKIVTINKLYRKIYYDRVLKDSTNSKKMWDNINLIINKKRPSSIIDNLQVNGKNLHQPASISNAINKYFCNAPTELASSLPKADRHFASFLRGKKCIFRFTKVSEVEVFLLLESIDCKKSFGYDKIHPLLLSSAALEIFRPVTYIINLTLKRGIFPDSLKIAKVIPIFKQGSRSSCGNYRPISVLCALSKIFERCILNQLIFYCLTENILVPNQYGFRSGYN